MEYLRAGQAVALLQGGAQLVTSFESGFIVIDGKANGVRRNVIDKLRITGRIEIAERKWPMIWWQWVPPQS